MKIGIMGAMLNEIISLTQSLEKTAITTIAKRDYLSGQLFNKEAVVVHSRWGKVAAASTVTTLIQQFNVDAIIFTGVAGAIADELKVGDVVLAEQSYQHDLDGRPVYQQCELPLIEQTFLKSDEVLFNAAKLATANFLPQGTT